MTLEAGIQKIEYSIEAWQLTEVMDWLKFKSIDVIDDVITEEFGRLELEGIRDRAASWSGNSSGMFLKEAYGQLSIVAETLNVLLKKERDLRNKMGEGD